MSESAEKQFDATPSRIAKARREGNVPRSSELGASLALLAALTALAGVLAPMAAAARAAFIAASAGRAPWSACAELLGYAAAPMIAAAAVGSAAGVLQSGGLTVTTPSFKLERLDPFAGCKRLFSRDAVAHALRAAFAFACAMLVTWSGARGVVASVSQSSPAGAAALAWRAALHAVLALAVVGGAFGALEFGLARAAWLRRLRMTFAEYKREMKEQDGDPHLRGRRRSLHRALSRGDMRRVREAAFVVCNPTHLAIALAYAPPREPVPRVLVSAADELALRVRELAAQHGIPMVENVPLARALYADARAGEPIPHEHYLAVAQVVAALLRSGALDA